MREMGLEPTREYTHKILSLACLPIPALPHSNEPVHFERFRDCKKDNIIKKNESQYIFCIFLKNLYIIKQKENNTTKNTGEMRLKRKIKLWKRKESTKIKRRFCVGTENGNDSQMVWQ